MKIALSTIGKFHTFDLARELEARGALSCIFTGYPRFKLKNERLSPSKIKSFPWLHTPYMAAVSRLKLGDRLKRAWEYADRVAFDHHVSARLPEHDVFVGLSSCALVSGRQAKASGARYVCDRGSSHIRTQESLLREEHRIWGMPYTEIDPRIIDREESEYAEADCITIPSTFSKRSFLQQGVSPDKLRVLPYGVNLSNFSPVDTPARGQLDVLFAGGASLRKGIPYLLEAFQRVSHPRKSLSFAGAFPVDLQAQMKRKGLWSEGIQLLGHLDWIQLKQRMSASTVLVLPSIEDGFGLVMAQAMACGCPVIASEHTGAPDMFKDSEAGFIVPIRRSDALADCLLRLADEPETRERLSNRGREIVAALGGWNDYGERALAIYGGLLQ